MDANTTLGDRAFCYMCEALGLVPLPSPQIRSSYYQSLVPKFCHLKWPSLSFSERWGTLRLKEKSFLGLRILLLLKFSNGTEMEDNLEGAQDNDELPSTTQKCWHYYFLSYTSVDVKLIEESGFVVRHTFIACWFINSLAERKLSLFFLFTWWSLMLPGQGKLLISLSQPPK